jgi:hypothetical protein
MAVELIDRTITSEEHRQAEDAVVVRLAALGDTCGQIARRLDEMGIKGLRGEPEDGPLSKYLDLTLGTARPMDAVSYIGDGRRWSYDGAVVDNYQVFVHFWDYHPGPRKGTLLQVHPGMTRAIWEFTHAFEAGFYPTLIATPKGEAS